MNGVNPYMVLAERAVQAEDERNYFAGLGAPGFVPPEQKSGEKVNLGRRKDDSI